jgi:ABC-2 type transport system permease protein
MTMRAQLRSELVKLRSTRTNLGLLIGMVGLVLLIVIITGVAVTPSELSGHDHQRAVFGLGLAGGFVAALIGVMSICSEYRHGTIRPTFVFTPKRGRVLTAKLLSSIALGAVFGMITEALAFGTGLLIIWARGAHVVLSSHDLFLIAIGSVACAALMAGLGLGFGAVARNQVLAVIGVVVWFMLVENIVVSAWPGVGRFFPLASGDSLTGIDSDKLLTAPQGALMLVGYVLAFFAAGLVMTRRSDVK